MNRDGTLNQKERQERIDNDKKYAPVFLIGSGLMVVVCALMNLIYLWNSDAFFSMLPITGLLGWFAFSQLSGRR